MAEKAESCNVGHGVNPELQADFRRAPIELQHEFDRCLDVFGRRLPAFQSSCDQPGTKWFCENKAIAFTCSTVLFNIFFRDCSGNCISELDLVITNRVTAQ